MRVSFYATLRPIVGARTVEVRIKEGATVRELIDELVRRWPDLRTPMLDERGELSRRVNVFVDGRSARHLRAGVGTALSAEQAVDVFPALAGG